MAIPLKGLIEFVSVQLHDEDMVGWAESELVSWLEEALGALAAVRPDLFMQTSVEELVPGARQETPANSVTVARVLGTRETESGAMRAVTPFDLRSMNAAHPQWQSDPPDRARQYTLVADARVFYVYPPQPDPAHFADIEHVVVPEVPAVGDSAYDDYVIGLDERFRRSLADYMFFRAYSKDSDVAGQTERAAAHYQAFIDSTGAAGG